MKTVTKQATRTWVLQAYLAVNPRSPKWTGIEFSAVNGWEKYQEWRDRGRTVWRDPRLTDSYSKWEFVSPEAAMEVLQELQGYEQDYFLRVIERQVVLTEQVVGGFHIEDGTVVKKPDGSVPTWGHEPVAECQEAMPEWIA
jgi:hypothetical protein